MFIWSDDIRIYKEYKGMYILKGYEVFEISEEVINILEFILNKEINIKNIPNNINQLLDNLLNLEILKRRD